MSNFSGYQDATFLAALSSTVSGDALIFDREEINPGGHYDSSTGVYTVPYDGIYQFSVNAQWNFGYVSVRVYVDRLTAGSHVDLIGDASTIYRSPTFILELTAGQTVEVIQLLSISGVRGCETSLCSYFTGHLISAY